MESKTKLKRIIQELEKYRGRHTELITVYIPAGYNINVIAKQLEAEKSTASNIKSKTTRKNVIDALEKIIRHLKLYKQTPANGLAIFCGNVSEKEGQPDIKIWAIEPPQPLNIKIYRCDQRFLLEPLKEMIKTTDIYGLVVIDRKEATLGLLEGKSIRVIKHLTSGAPGKIKAGGQSALRFSRIIEGIVKEFYRRVAEAMKEAFFDMKELKGILLGGPGPSKETFLKEGQLVTELKNKIIAIRDIGYANEYGLEDLVNACQDVLAKKEVSEEKQILTKFFEMLAKNKSKVAYGIENVMKALQLGSADTVIVSSSIDDETLKKIEEMAKNISAKVVIVSNETSEGKQFENFAKVGAILRFCIE